MKYRARILGHHRWASWADSSADTEASSSQDGFMLESLMFAQDRTDPDRARTAYLTKDIHLSLMILPCPHACSVNPHTHLHTICLHDTVLGTEEAVEKDGQKHPRKKGCIGLRARPVFHNWQNHASLRGFHLNAEGSAWKPGLDSRLNKWSRSFIEVPWYSGQEQGLWS